MIKDTGYVDFPYRADRFMSWFPSNPVVTWLLSYLMTLYIESVFLKVRILWGTNSGSPKYQKESRTHQVLARVMDNDSKHEFYQSSNNLSHLSL